MDPVNKAVWYIESHSGEALSLDEIAAAAGVSRFHFSRAFTTATGQSAIRYLRGRRLSLAARALCNGAHDILSVALDSGYGSHEAFTRAFREQFGITPEQLRAERRLETLNLVEPIKMTESLLTNLTPPRFEQGRAMLIAGLAERYSCNDGAGIPAQWQRFLPEMGHVPGQQGDAAYGVCCNQDDEGNFDYIAGVAVCDFSALPAHLARLRIPAQRYAVFRHERHISEIRRTVHTIWSQWLPESGHQAADAPNFERYGPEFDGRTGMGGLEIWIPLKG